MTKREFCDYVHARNKKRGVQVTKGEVKWWVDFLSDEIVKAVLDEGSVIMPGFGIFRQAEIKSRAVRAADGGTFEVAAHPILRFTPSVTVKQAYRQCESSNQYIEWKSITDDLRNGKEVPGWKLKNNYAVKTGEEEAAQLQGEDEGASSEAVSSDPPLSE